MTEVYGTGRDGEAFYNLLCLIPLRDATGSIGERSGISQTVASVLTFARNSVFHRRPSQRDGPSGSISRSLISSRLRH